MNLFDTLPFRAIRGTWMGFEDGLRGRVDENEKFSDGAREDDPSKKSTAGAFLSDRAGIMGGSETGKTIGKWVGGVGGIAAMGYIAVGMLAAGAAVSILPAILMIGAAGFIGAGVGGLVGKYGGGVFGAITGAVAGAAVGLYNGVFRRGPYEKAKEPETQLLPQTAPQQPQQACPAPEKPAPAKPAPSKAANLARALQQAEAGMQAGDIGRNMTASPQEVAAAAQAQPRFANRVQQSADKGQTR